VRLLFAEYLILEKNNRKALFILFYNYTWSLETLQEIFLKISWFFERKLDLSIFSMYFPDSILSWQ
jgi:hypothetical protein